MCVKYNILGKGGACMASEEEKKAADENSEKNKKASGSEDKENGNIWRMNMHR